MTYLFCNIFNTTSFKKCCIVIFKVINKPPRSNLIIFIKIYKISLVFYSDVPAIHFGKLILEQTPLNHVHFW